MLSSFCFVFLRGVCRLVYFGLGGVGLFHVLTVWIGLGCLWACGLQSLVACLILELVCSAVAFKLFCWLLAVSGLGLGFS